MILTIEKLNKIIAERPNALFDVVVIMDNICNADCPVCVAKHKIKNEKCKEQCAAYTIQCARCCDRTASDEVFFSKLEDLIRKLRNRVTRFIVTGGEPSISTRLNRTMDLLNKYRIKNISLETNGTNLCNVDILSMMMSNNVEILLSRYAIDDAVNIESFGGCNEIPNNYVLRQIAKHYGHKMTLNCILMLNNVDTATKLLEYQSYYKQMGIERFNFTELMFDVNLKDNNKDIYNIYIKKVIPIEKIAEELISMGFRKIIDTGDSYRIIGLMKGDNYIELSRADMSKIATEHQNNEVYTKLLMYPSGEVGVHSVE